MFFELVVNTASIRAFCIRSVAGGARDDGGASARDVAVASLPFFLMRAPTARNRNSTHTHTHIKTTTASILGECFGPVFFFVLEHLGEAWVEKMYHDTRQQRRRKRTQDEGGSGTADRNDDEASHYIPDAHAANAWGRDAELEPFRAVGRGLYRIRWGAAVSALVAVLATIIEGLFRRNSPESFWRPSTLLHKLADELCYWASWLGWHLAWVTDLYYILRDFCDDALNLLAGLFDVLWSPMYVVKGWYDYYVDYHLSEWLTWGSFSILVMVVLAALVLAALVRWGPREWWLRRRRQRRQQQQQQQAN